MSTAQDPTRHVREVTAILGDPRLPDVTKVDGCYSPEDLDAVVRIKEALSELQDYRFVYFNNHERLLGQLIENPPRFVLNLCDTGWRNVQVHELHLPALLDMLGIPYTGSGPMAMARCYDKALVRAVAMAHGIPVPQETFLRAGDTSRVEAPRLPAIIKPNQAEGSVGIDKGAVVRTAKELQARIERLRSELPQQDILIQEFLEGAEYGLGLIGNPEAGFTVLPLLEVDYSALEPGLPKILSYESKTVPDSPFWRQIRYRQATLADADRERLVEYSKFLFRRLELRDYGRFDFRTDAGGEIKLLEVNANPAWCWDGKLNIMAGFGGCKYSDLMRLILEAAEKRVAA